MPSNSNLSSTFELWFPEQHFRRTISNNTFQAHAEFQMTRGVFSKSCGCGTGSDKLLKRLGSSGASPSSFCECTGGFGASPSSIWKSRTAQGQARAALSSALGASKRTRQAFPEVPAVPSKRIRTIRTLWGRPASQSCDFERPYGVRAKWSSGLRGPREPAPKFRHRYT